MSRDPEPAVPPRHALLLHSPLVGPATMAPLAGELRRYRWTVDLPTLPQTATLGDYVAAAVTTASAADVVIGHSGAGVAVPSAALRAEAAMLFLDAVLPDAGPEFRPSDEFVGFVDALPRTDGRLPPWHRWWPEGTMAGLLPDAALRSAIEREIPRLPADFYDGAVTLPAGWSARPAGYVQISAAYDDEATRARTLGWPTTNLDGQHLDVAARPLDVAAAVIRVTEAMLAAG